MNADKRANIVNNIQRPVDLSEHGNANGMEANVVESVIVPGESMSDTRGKLYDVASRAYRVGSRTVQLLGVGAVTAQLDIPLRYGAFFTALDVSGHNSFAGGAAFGLATLATEVPAGLAMASLRESDTAKALVNRIKGDLDTTGITSATNEDKEISVSKQVALAMTLGTPALVGAKSLKDPSRTIDQNRATAIKSGSYMAAYFTAEGIATAKSIDIFGIPKTLAGAVLFLAGLKYVTSKVLDGDRGLNPGKKYGRYQDEKNDLLKIGVYGEDIESAESNAETIMYTYKKGPLKGDKAPLLVPAGSLEWFNEDLIRDELGAESEPLVYSHLPVDSKKDKDAILGIFDEALSSGKTILTEIYEKDEDSPAAHLLRIARNQGSYEINSFEGSGESSRVDYFVGHVNFNNAETVKETQSITEIYNDLLAEGSLEIDPLNGPDLAPVVEGHEAEEIWQLYRKPFEDLGKHDPTLAGFSRESLLEILADPNIVKIVNRVDGKISTLVLFLHDFKKAPWFNKAAFERDYPEYVKTNNVLLFPGIVTDESMRGNDYAHKAIDFALNLYNHRGSNAMIAFECTQVSTQYVPPIVAEVINNSGYANVAGLDKPRGSVRYYAISKSSDS